MSDNNTTGTLDATTAFNAGLPQFMRAHFNPIEPNKVSWIDGWDVKTTGDLETDRIVGEAFAVEVVSLANQQSNHALVTLALSCIVEKACRNQLTTECSIEHSFISKLARMACAGSKN